MRACVRACVCVCVCNITAVGGIGWRDALDHRWTIFLRTLNKNAGFIGYAIVYFVLGFSFGAASLLTILREEVCARLFSPFDVCRVCFFDVFRFVGWVTVSDCSHCAQ